MDKGRRIKFEKSRRLDRMLKMQQKAFRRKFGRDPGPGDPLFFDPEADTPQPMAGAVVEEGMREFAKQLLPHIAYAYRQDGRLASNRGKYRPNGRLPSTSTGVSTATKRAVSGTSSPYASASQAVELPNER